MIKAGVDWGSSSLRAYRLDGQQVIDTVSSDRGIKTLKAKNKETQFEHVLFNLVGDWLEPGDGIILSGMVTSVNGWVETPYLPCPVSCAALASNLTHKIIRECDLYFVSGVRQDSPQPDVMRGEELQLLGEGAQHSHSLVIMPGTHSKWAQLRDGTIEQFRTIMTGELFDVMRNQTLVGQLADGTDWHQAAFTNGVEQGFTSQTIISDLFTCRSGVLLNQLAAEEIHSYLSGLLIGNEIKEGISITTDFSEITLIGADSLCDKYRLALTHLNLNASIQNENPLQDAAAKGYLQLMQDIN